MTSSFRELSNGDEHGKLLANRSNGSTPAFASASAKNYSSITSSSGTSSPPIVEQSKGSSVTSAYSSSIGNNLSAGNAISRPSSAASMRVTVDKQTNEDIKGNGLFTHVPSGYDNTDSGSIWVHRGGAPAYGLPTLYSTIKLQLNQLLANTLSSIFLILVIIWALSVRLFAAILHLLHFSLDGLTRREKEEIKVWDDPPRWKQERLVKDVRYYAKSCGFEIINETVETDDGYRLRLHRVLDPQRKDERHSDGKGGFPVLIMHGLFQSSGSFVTSEERSLAFWLARRGGYQVFLGNNRGVFDMGHKTLQRSDPRFWDYNIRELAIYDLPALIDWIRRDTGYDRIAFIGHSQGNGTMFISLSQGMAPSLGPKLTYFGALAPAVFAGPLTSCFPFTTLASLDWPTWKRYFGVLDFIPLMKISYDWTPALPYALLGYQMFAFLFAWTDANWLPRRKAKMFRFTPQPVSSASIYWWTGKDGFSTRGCTMDPNLPKWWDKRFPPLSIYSGGVDFLVLTEPLLERIKVQETDVQLIRYKRQEEAEHCDHFWAADAVEWCFEDILEDIERTRTRYPEELEQEPLQQHSQGQDTINVNGKREKTVANGIAQPQRGNGAQVGELVDAS